IAALSLSLSACTSRWSTPPLDFTSSNMVREASYKAADQLAGQSISAAGRETALAVATLSDVNNIETSSALGRMIAEQVGARFVQLGYNVSEVKLRNDISVLQLPDDGASAGEYVLSRDAMQLAGKTNARAVVTGTYAVGGDTILVNLRMIDTNTSRILAAHDYARPMNADTRRLIDNEEGGTIFSKGWAQ